MNRAIFVFLVILNHFVSVPLEAQCTAREFDICTAMGRQAISGPAIASDGDGGAIISWVFNGSGLFAQRVDSEGRKLWANCGIPVIEGAIFSWCVPDTKGGAVFGAIAGSERALVVQRVEGDGTLAWPGAGVSIASGCSFFRAASDGEGGIVIIWTTAPDGVGELFAQRVNEDGSVVWPAGGIDLGISAYIVPLRACPDGMGGAYFVWTGDDGGSANVFAQRLGGDGSIAWDSGGIRVCTNDAGRGLANVASDGRGGAIVTWRDNRVSTNAIYAQKLGADGSRIWFQEGVLVWTGDTQWQPEIAGDGRGGAIIAWQGIFDSAHTIVAQRVSENGDVRWPVNGVPTGGVFAQQPSNPLPIVIVSDGRGGCIVGWKNYEGATADIYAQRIAPDGTLRCGSGGLPVCAAAGDQIQPFGVSDGLGGAILAWTDMRNDVGDIYGARVFGGVEPRRVSFDIRPGSCPNPLNPKSEGVLPAAILGTAELDVHDIDPASIELMGVSPLRWSFEDAATPQPDDSPCACTENGQDGFVDLLLKFDTPALVANLEGIETGQMIELSIDGILLDGTGIEGSDCVRIVGEGPKKDPQGRGRLHIAVESTPTDIIQRLSFTLNEQSPVEISVYDVAGRLVGKIENAIEPAGTHTRDWNTTGLASGVYFCRFEAGKNVLTKKMILLR